MAFCEGFENVVDVFAVNVRASRVVDQNYIFFF